MKIVVYGLNKRTGVISGDEVVDIAGVVAKHLTETGDVNGAASAETVASSDLGRFIAGGDAALDALEAALAHLGKAKDRNGVGGVRISVPLKDATLHAPRAAGARVACAGGNFADHAAAMAERAKEKGDDRGFGDRDPRDVVRDNGRWGFWKVDRESLGQDGVMSYPKRTEWLDYEGEAAIVIGKPGKDIKAADLARHVWGITLLGDWSARLTHETGPMKFALQKNFDGSCSIGPCIAVREAGFEDVKVETLVNGDVRQSFSTADMVYSFGEYMEFLARDFTFYPGDILAGGTAAGTAMDSSPTGDNGKPVPDRFLKKGDKVEIRSPQVGTLRTSIV